MKAKNKAQFIEAWENHLDELNYIILAVKGGYLDYEEFNKAKETLKKFIKIAADKDFPNES